MSPFYFIQQLMQVLNVTSEIYLEKENKVEKLKLFLKHQLPADQMMQELKLQLLFFFFYLCGNISLRYLQDWTTDVITVLSYTSRLPCSSIR